MRITQLHLSGHGTWSDLRLESLKPDLNVFFASPRAGKSTVAQLASHLLYGKTSSSWRDQFGQRVPAAEGSLRVNSAQGSFVLRREHDANRPSRLTIVSEDGSSVDSQTVRSLLSQLSPQLASRLLSIDFADSPNVDWLLSDRFAREYATSQVIDRHCQAAKQTSSALDRIDRRRVEELIHQRDSIALELEKQVSTRRQESDVLDRELADVDRHLTERRERFERLQSGLHRVETQLAEVEARVRLYSLDQQVIHENREKFGAYPKKWGDQLDPEINRCRQSLADLQSREQVVRSELAQWSPDGTADSVTHLTDSRATLGVMEQLLDELESEVSRLAQTHDPSRCPARDAHSKISPVATLMRQQVYSLCGLLTEQERFSRRTQLTAEVRQLTRVQTDLAERLDQLLAQREWMVLQSQSAGRSALHFPQPPVQAHCSCEHHGDFVQHHDLIPGHPSDFREEESTLHRKLDSLQRERTTLCDESACMQSEIHDAEERWKDLQRERAGLIGGAAVGDLKSELERLERVIHQALESSQQDPRLRSTSPWRASDVLAQLTKGEFTQIRLERHRHRATVVDHLGQSLGVEQLSSTQQDLLYLALTLALVDSFGRRGIALPLLLDEPFLRQEAAGTARMCDVLKEFAQAGHQLLVFTEDREARRRFELLGTTLFDLEDLRGGASKENTVTLCPKVTTTATQQDRLVRQSVDDHGTPVLRLAQVGRDSSGDDLFYLTETARLDEFPVLGAETNATFARLDLHTVADLLKADPAEVARRLDRKGIDPPTVQLWQIHMGLMCYVPELMLEDAQLLSANGITSLADLCDADADQLWLRVDNFLRSERGKHFKSTRHRFSQTRSRDWIRGARSYRQQWTRSRKSQQSSSLTRSKSDSQAAERPTRQRVQQDRQLRFHLSRQSDVEAAPSIGPKTAKRLYLAGIRKVADLLNADARSVAEELSVSHITATKITSWQQQARLVCQIPELPGYAAQLLVAIGLTQPKQVADMDTEELASRVTDYCYTKQGQRIVRSGDAPDRDKIVKWKEDATHRRPLEAA